MNYRGNAPITVSAENAAAFSRFVQRSSTGMCECILTEARIKKIFIFDKMS